MIRHNGIILDRVRQTIIHRDRKKVFFTGQNRSGHPPVGFKLWEALIVGRCDHYALFERAYGDHLDGGPIAGEKVIDIRLNQWIPEFTRMRLFLDKDKRAGCRFYQLVPIDVV